MKGCEVGLQHFSDDPLNMQRPKPAAFSILAVRNYRFVPVLL